MSLDQTDQDIFAAREEEFNRSLAPKIGDAVRFPDGKISRMAHVWGSGPDNWEIQTSKGGSHYLYGSTMDFSGTLASSLPFQHFRRTEERVSADCWVFHHGQVAPGGRVNGHISVPVWECDVLQPY